MLTVVLYGLLAIGLMGGLFLLAARFLPAGEQIAPALRDEPVWSLPADRNLKAVDIEELRLPVSLRGYRFAETDELLDRLVAELRRRDDELERLYGVLIGMPVSVETPAAAEGPGPGAAVVEDGGPGVAVVEDGGPGVAVVEDGGPGVAVVEDGGPGAAVAEDGGPGAAVVEDGGPGVAVVEDGGPGAAVAEDGGPGAAVVEDGGPGVAVAEDAAPPGAAAADENGE